MRGQPIVIVPAEPGDNTFEKTWEVAANYRSDQYKYFLLVAAGVVLLPLLLLGLVVWGLFKLVVNTIALFKEADA